jgi:hypothetical protein
MKESTTANALEFIREQLLLAAGEGFDGPLASRLCGARLTRAFAFLPPSSFEEATKSYTDGLRSDKTADTCTAIALSRWLASPAPEHKYSVHFEEPLARFSDPFVARQASGVDSLLHYGERVYYSVFTGDGFEQVANAMSRVSGYPGIGVMAAWPEGGERPFELSAKDLDAIARRAVAVLVRAWDDEAFMIAPVGDARVEQELLSGLVANLV